MKYYISNTVKLFFFYLSWIYSWIHGPAACCHRELSGYTVAAMKDFEFHLGLRLRRLSFFRPSAGHAVVGKRTTR
jgi:hypothetical protein